MSRKRYVGKQAAGDQDILTLGVLNAALATLPGQYLELSRLNQPMGVPQLDANSRMGNAYLPTDISQTTLTATGKAKAGSAEVVGALTAASAAVANNATVGGTLGVTGNETVGGTLGVTGAISGASATVTGQVKAATADIPEIVTAALKVKALTVDSIQNPVGGLKVSGDLNAQTGSVLAALDIQSGRDALVTRNLTAAKVTASGEVVAGSTVRGVNGVLTGELDVSGDVSAATASVSGKATIGTAEISADAIVYGSLGLAGTLVTKGQNDYLSYLESRIAVLENGAPLVNWIAPTLVSGATSSSTDPVLYRLIKDNGRFKIQLRGRINLTSALTTLWTMPAGYRPALNLAGIAISRDGSGGSTSIILDIASSGTINLSGHTVGAKSGNTDVGSSGGALVNTSQPDNAPYVAGGYAATSAVSAFAGSDNHRHNFDHTHRVTGLTHQHGVAAVTFPSFIGLTGVEYFL